MSHTKSLRTANAPDFHGSVNCLLSLHIEALDFDRLINFCHEETVEHENDSSLDEHSPWLQLK